MARQFFEDDAGFEDLVEACVHPVQVQHHRVDNRTHRRLGDDKAPSGAPPGAGDLLVLHQSNRLTEYSSTDLVTLEQVRLGTEDLADGPTQCHDVLDDEVRHLGRPLRVGVGARPRHIAGGRLGGHLPILPGHPAHSDGFDQRLHQEE